MKTRHPEIAPYITRDGSEIRELMHPGPHQALGVRAQSLAEARVPARQSTRAHRHRRTEDIYHIQSGHGRMRLADDWFEIGPGDTICIPPGTVHALHNSGDDTLVVLCACSPPYSHDDTELSGDDV